MSEKQKEILENLSEVLPQLDDMGKVALLSYGEGMVAQKQLAKEKGA